MKRYYRLIAAINGVVFILFVLLFICVETDISIVKEILDKNSIEHDTLFLLLCMMGSGGGLLLSVRLLKTHIQDNPNGNTLKIGKNNGFNDIEQVRKGE